MTKKILYSIVGVSALLIFIIILLPESSSTTKQNPQVLALWDMPMLMNKSHNQIVKILGNPTIIQKLSDGKSERFKFVDNQMQRFFVEDLPARRGMKVTEYDISYKKSDCGMMVCGNDLEYSYTNPDQPVKYFFIDNYPIENPTSSVVELKRIGNLIEDTTTKVIPDYVKRPEGMVLVGLGICEKSYQGSEYEYGSENCSK